MYSLAAQLYGNPSSMVGNRPTRFNTLIYPYLSITATINDSLPTEGSLSKTVDKSYYPFKTN